MNKIYGYEAYQTIRDMLDFITWRDDSAAAHKLYQEFELNKRALTDYQPTRFCASYSMYIWTNGEIDFHFKDDMRGLSTIKKIEKYIMTMFDRNCTDYYKERFDKLIKAIEVGGTDWNIPFGPFKEAKLESILQMCNGSHTPFMEVFINDD
jgi:hypothetical protein